MKRANSFLQVVLGLTLVGVLGIGLIAVFSTMSRLGEGDALTEIPLNLTSPSSLDLPVATQTLHPYPYPPPPQTTHVSIPTSTWSYADVTAQAATQIAQMTAAAPTPSGSVISDPSGQFTLTLLPGWEASVGRTVTIYNYDNTNMGSEGNFPPGGLKIQIGIGELQPGQSFDQWLSEWIAISTAPDSNLPTLTATDPQPYTLGHYTGVSYFINSEPQVMEIDLLQDETILSIGLTPADSSALNEALLMLSSIQITR